MSTYFPCVATTIPCDRPKITKNVWSKNIFWYEDCSETPYWSSVLPLRKLWTPGPTMMPLIGGSKNTGKAGFLGRNTLRYGYRTITTTGRVFKRRYYSLLDIAANIEPLIAENGYANRIVAKIKFRFAYDGSFRKERYSERVDSGTKRIHIRRTPVPNFTFFTINDVLITDTFLSPLTSEEIERYNTQQVGEYANCAGKTHAYWQPSAVKTKLDANTVSQSETIGNPNGKVNRDRLCWYDRVDVYPKISTELNNAVVPLNNSNYQITITNNSISNNIVSGEILFKQAFSGSNIRLKIVTEGAPPKRSQMSVEWTMDYGPYDFSDL